MPFQLLIKEVDILMCLSDLDYHFNPAGACLWSPNSKRFLSSCCHTYCEFSQKAAKTETEISEKKHV